MPETVSILPRPHFVEDIAIHESVPSDQSINIQWLLIDQQFNVSERSVYSRRAMKILDEVGLKDCANLSVPFDPSQKFALHSIHIIRDGKRLDRMIEDKIKVIQRERDLESGIYDGRYYMIYFLDDVRVGDILDYSYSTIDTQPLLENDFSLKFLLQYPWSISKLHYRIVHPFGEQLLLRHGNSEWSRYCKRKENEVSWLVENSPPNVWERNQPNDFYYAAQVEVTTFPNWKSVINWSLPKYELSRTFKQDPEVVRLVNDWKHCAECDSERILLALRFVQDEIRYLGLEDGLKGHNPEDPLDVLRQRYGDCKGKTQLFRAFLDCMDIRSYPCLVNMNENPSLAEKLPSPFSFDHVIASVDVNGEWFYLDPTIILQGGDLKSSQSFSYKNGLILSDNAESFIDLPKNSSPGQLKIETSLKLNPDLSGKITIQSTFTGEKANYMRYRMRAQKREDIERDFHRSISTLFPSIKIDVPLEFNDDRIVNKIVSKESYTTHNLWQESEVVSFAPLEICDALTQTIDADRKTPLALFHPNSIIEEIVFDGVNASLQNWNVDHPAFSCSCTFSKLGTGRSKVVYNLNTHLDVLPSTDVSEYAASLKKAKNSCEISIPKTSVIPADIPHESWHGVAMLGLIAVAIFIIKILHKRLA